MQNQSSNDFLDSLNPEELDFISLEQIEKNVQKVESNTDWNDTSKHLTTNGQGMNC